MSTKLYQQLSQSSQLQTQQQSPAGLIDFIKNFKGDPVEQVQQLMNSGRISQEKYNQAVNKTNTLYQLYSKMYSWFK